MSVTHMGRIRDKSLLEGTRPTEGFKIRDGWRLNLHFAKIRGGLATIRDGRRRLNLL